jgi:hypothetical protein
MEHRLVYPRIYLIHKYYNWARDFGSKEELVQYLLQHGFTKRRLSEYMVVFGEGLWNEIASELPTHPEPTPGMGQAENQSVF